MSGQVGQALTRTELLRLAWFVPDADLSSVDLTYAPDIRFLLDEVAAQGDVVAGISKAYGIPEDTLLRRSREMGARVAPVPEEMPVEGLADDGTPL